MAGLYSVAPRQAGSRTAIVLTTFALLADNIAIAQENPDLAADALVDELVVTGSRLKRRDFHPHHSLPSLCPSPLHHRQGPTSPLWWFT